MRVTLSDEALQLIARFEDVTGAVARDCLIESDRVTFLVAPGEMADAIGPGGKAVNRAEDRLGKTVQLVEDADNPEAFVANALAPAAVYNVTISENDTRVAYVEVAEEDKGIAIGAGGRTIDVARTLAKRHYDIDDVVLT